MAQLVHVFGCRNPNATKVSDLRQYMYWAENVGHGFVLHSVLFDGQYDYMNTEPIMSPEPEYERYDSLIEKGWIPMTKDELAVHFPHITNSTCVGIPS